MRLSKEKPEIVFVYAGWTLGMNRKPWTNLLAPPKNGTDFKKVAGPTIRDFQTRFWAKVDFHLFDTMDSTNRDPLSIRKLFECLDSLQNRAHAIVVGHGTDTAATVASSIGLWMANPFYPWTTKQTCPIVVTAAQKPLIYKEGDAVSNLFHALETAYLLSSRSISRTVIAFHDKILAATRAMKTHDDHFDAFDSPWVPRLWDITAHGVNIYDHVWPINYRRHKLPFDIWGGISNIIISPSMRTGQLYAQALPDEHDSSIITTLWAGNVPTRLLPDIEKLTSRGHRCILATPFAWWKVSQVYESGSDAISAGGISARDMLPTTAEMKALLLRWYWVVDREKFIRLFQTPWLDDVRAINS